MPDQDMAAVRTALLAVAVARPEHWPHLDGLDDHVAHLVRLFTAHPDVEYPEEAKKLQLGGKTANLLALFTDWQTISTVEQCPYAVVYWAGHGTRDGDECYLIANDTPRKLINPWRAISAKNLAQSLMTSNFERITIIIDACHSKDAAIKIAAAVGIAWSSSTSPKVQSRVISVLASSETNEEAKSGAFTKALLEVLEKGAPDHEWEVGDRFINPETLIRVINKQWRDESQRPEHVVTKTSAECIPNPRYLDNPVPHTIDEESRSDFITRSRGIDVGEFGWFFSGRTSVLRDIVRWLEEAKSGMLVLTGSAGSGKSAILGRIATLSDPDMRAQAQRANVFADAQPDTVPRQRAIDVAIQVKKRNVGECARKIATGLQLDRQILTADQLVEALRLKRGRITILVDGLDEAAAGQELRIARLLLAPLASLPGKRVLVGTRRTGGQQSTQNANQGLLFDSLGASYAIDLDDAQKPEIQADIQDYVWRRLTETVPSPYRDRSDDVARRVSRAVATQADGNFLFARIVAKTLAARDDVIDPDTDALPDNVESAFEEDLARFRDYPEVWDMLAALAFAEGGGLPRQHWLALATEVRASHRILIPAGVRQQYDDETVKRVLARAGSYVTRASDSGQTVYRLYHQKLAEYFRNRLR